MAFFKFRLPGQSAEPAQGNATPTPAESVEAMRRRARHRLIGASVLVVLGVVGFPVVFDTQPRPVSVDIAIDIPDRATSKPLVKTPAPKPLATTAALDPKEEVVEQKAPKATTTKPDAEVALKESSAPEVKTEPKPEAKPEAKAEVKAETKATETKAADKNTANKQGRFVVQAGTFADDSKMNEVRHKLDKAGIPAGSSAALRLFS